MAITKVTAQDFDKVNAAVTELRDYFTNRSCELGRPLTYNIRTYGCQLNESDSEKLSGYLEQMGLVPVEEGPADVNFFNTCSIRENADDRLYGNLGVYKAHKKQNRDMIIAVCGCMMKVDKNIQKIKNSYPFVDLLFDPQQLHLMPVLLKRSISSKKTAVDIEDVDYIADDNNMPVSRKRKFRALVPIMYGCNNFCTYCIVPFTRGRERSRDFDEIIKQMEELAKEGYKEVMLLGQNVNSYGKDLGENRSFPDLLEACAKIKGFSRIRFMTSHPKDLSDRVIEIMAKYDSIETHLHLPCQSGSDAVLKRMNRHYTREQFVRTAKLFRQMIPEGAISTDIIVGFPGETEEDFQATCDLVRAVGYTQVFTFIYSPREGTPAAKMPNDTPREVIQDRFDRLRDIVEEEAWKANRKDADAQIEVLVEGVNRKDAHAVSGRSPKNQNVHVVLPEGQAPEELIGSIVSAKVTDPRPWFLRAQMTGLVER